MSKKILIPVIILVILGLGAFLASNWYNSAIYSSASTETKDIEVEVAEGDNFLTLLPQLNEKGLIRDENAVRIYLRLNSVSPELKVGSYTILSTVNIPELIDILEVGAFKKSVLITVPEGLRYEQIAAVLTTNFKELGDEAVFTSKEFKAIAAKPDNYTFSSEVGTFLKSIKPSKKSLEGLLFPDTYRFDVDATSQTVIETMVLNLKTKLEAEDISEADINKSSTVSSLYKGIILASILEKESNGNDDRAIISGIFYNRLNQNYPLQADSTVNYITGKNDPGVLIADTLIDSPYNTYKYAGLTPGPIANPGIAAIKAAIKPKSTDYFFFVHDKNGKVYYAVTYEQHQANIANYL